MIYTPVFLALTSLLSSCAILSVDVDVYKGPLVNEEIVQIKQLEAVRVAAIPLLATLRDSIEWRDSGGKKPEGINGYKGGYIKDPDQILEVTHCSIRQKLFTACKDEAKGFRNPIAKRVNEVLGYLEYTVDKKGDLSQIRIDSVSQNYLMALYNIPNQPKNLDWSSAQDKEKLSNEATLTYANIAARLLFLANHDGLLADHNSSGLIFGGLGNLGRGLFGDSPFESFSPGVAWDNMQGTGTLAYRSRTQFVRVLQAVGNSMLVLVNELQHQKEARAGGPLRAKTEASAIESAFVADPVKVYMNLLHEVEEERKGQAALEESLKARLPNIVLEMEGIKKDASLVKEAGDWNKEKLTAEQNYNALLGKPTGALKLLDIQNLDSAFEKLTGKPSSQEEAWDAIYTQTPKALQNDELAKKAKEHLETLRKDKSLTLSLDSYLKSWELVKAKLQDERRVLEGQKKDLDDLNRLLLLFAERNSKLESRKSAEERLAALGTTYTIVKDAKNKVLEELANQNTFTSSKGVYLTLAIALRESKNTETDTTKQAAIQTALNELNQRTPPPIFAISPNLSDAKDVLDQEIALLRQEHIQAVRAGGTGAESVGKALAAIEAALQHRAGMVQLRPASAYLRTSYPSTSLQDDPNLTWDNLLLQQGLRDIPFSNYLAELFNPDKKHDEKITAELDKQYWQNINRVRVSGMGTTNYVLAKDDVGNWYVKHYSGDTGQIFESARKLGMFNLAGAGANASLLASLKKQNSSNAESGPATEPTPLQRVFDRHRTAYETQTKADLTSLHDLTIGDGLRTAIRDGWKPLASDSNEPTEGTLAAFLIAPADQLKESITKIERDDKTRPGVKVVQSLQAVHSFHRAVRINIENSKMTPDTKTATLKILAHTIQDKLSGVTDNRQHLIQEYEQAIMFIGDATSPQNDPDKKDR